MMAEHLVDWLNLTLRWAHLVAGIWWIGTSFYFIWLDRNLTSPGPLRPGVESELWMVHSGGFYQVERRRLRAHELPATLHWFKWEAAATWITGFGLLVVVYYLGGGLALVDPAVSGIGVGSAIAVGIGSLAASWAVYDALWQSPLARRAEGVAVALSAVLLAGATYGLTRVFSGRAAYIHVGAMLGTLMVANVWMRILPAQRALIEATAAGRPPDWTLGDHAKRRSVHNSYATLPVLFIMLSTHFPATYGHRWNWLVLLLLTLAGAVARHVLIVGLRAGGWTLAPTAALLVAAFVLTLPGRPGARGADGQDRVPFGAARVVVAQRCVSCHSAYPSDRAFGVAPGGVSFDTPESLRTHAERIKLRTVIARTMPLANRTAMTEEERALLGRWVDQGARLD